MIDKTIANTWGQKMAVSALNRHTHTKERWHYTDGLLFKGIWHIWEQTRDHRYWDRLAGYVDHFVTENGEINMVNIFGEQKRLRARIKSLSLVDHRIVLEPLG